MPWTIGGIPFDDDSLNVTACSVSKAAGGMDSASLTLAIPGDAAAPFAVDEDVDIATPGGVTFFRGIVADCRPNLTGESEGWILELDGRTASLKAITLQQPIACVPEEPEGEPVIKYGSLCNLGWSADGVRQNTAEIITDILTYAEGQNSNLTAGSILSGVEVTAPQMEVTDVTCEEAIRGVMRWHPDAVLWYDHASGQLNITRPGGMSSVSVQATGDTGVCTALSPGQRVVRKVRGVEINWQITSTLNGTEHVDIVKDSAGATTGRNIVRLTVPLQGAQGSTQSAEVEVAEIPEEPEEVTEDWLIAHFSQLRETGIDLDVVTGHAKVRSIAQTVLEEEEVGPGTTLESYPNELIKGSIHPWMASISACRVVLKVEIIFTGSREDNPRLYDMMEGSERRIFLQAEIMGTDAITKTYQASTGSAGESPITGMAADYYAALNTDWPEGSTTISAEEIDPAICPGKKLNVTGDVTVTGGLIQSCQYDVMEGITTVEYGPAGLLSPNDLVELLRTGSRSRPLVNGGGGFRTDSSAGAGGGSIKGATGGRITGGLVTPATPRALRPFHVTQVSCGETDGVVAVNAGRVAWAAHATTEDGNEWPVVESLRVEQDIAMEPGIAVSGSKKIWLRVPYSIRGSTTIRIADEASREPGATLTIDGADYGLTGVLATQFYYPEPTAAAYEARNTGAEDDPDPIDPAYAWLLVAQVVIDDGVMSITEYLYGTQWLGAVYNPDSRIRTLLVEL